MWTPQIFFQLLQAGPTQFTPTFEYGVTVAVLIFFFSVSTFLLWRWAKHLDKLELQRAAAYDRELALKAEAKEAAKEHADNMLEAAEKQSGERAMLLAALQAIDAKIESVKK